MNKIIVAAIIATGVANDHVISTADTRELNDHLFLYNYEEWLELHGDDEGDIETGYHNVQGDGAKTTLFGRNAVNRVADSIYHLGFETHKKTVYQMKMAMPTLLLKRSGDGLTLC
ncbi:MAG: hypothetical protein V3U75_10765 [Methylococcaceae bacterium]